MLMGLPFRRLMPSARRAGSASDTSQKCAQILRSCMHMGLQCMHRRMPGTCWLIDTCSASGLFKLLRLWMCHCTCGATICAFLATRCSGCLHESMQPCVHAPQAGLHEGAVYGNKPNTLRYTLGEPEHLVP